MSAAALVFDNSPLNYFTRAGCLGVLEAITRTYPRFTTSLVREEIRVGLAQAPELQQILDAEWLGVVGEDVRTISEFARISRRLGRSGRDRGEASVIAWCLVHGGTAVIDDQAGVKLAREEEVNFTRSLNLVATALNEGRMSELQAETVIGLCRDAEAYFPDVHGSVLEWMRQEGIIQQN